MECLDAIRTRRTCKKFSKQPVEFEKLMAVCEAGMMAPSSGNIQNWIFIVSRDKDILHNDLFEACLQQNTLKTAQAAVIVCGDDAMGERHYGLRGQRLYTVQNCAAAIQNMLLAAHDLGLGGAWIGAFNEEKVKTIYQIPDHTGRPQAVLVFGYPSSEKPEDKRMRHIDDVCRFETYTLRYRDIHLGMKDWSIEIERQKKEFMYRYGDSVDNVKKKAMDFLSKFSNMMKKQDEKDKKNKK